MEANLDFLSDVQMLHKEFLRNGVLKSTQTTSCLSGQSIKDVILNKCYLPLSVNYGNTHKCVTLDLDSVMLQQFGEGTEGGKLLLCGGQGMGKTTALEQLVWDWASGIRFQHLEFIFPLCSSVLRGPEHSLQSILLSTHPHISAEHLETILTTPHTIMFVIDDAQDLLSNDPEFDNLISDLHQPSEGTVLVRSLLQGSLLPGVSLLLTSREAVESKFVRCARLLGFTSFQRKAFFRRFFDNKDKGEQILYRCEQAVGVMELGSCPGFCWTLCCVYKEQLEIKNGGPETLSELYCLITHKLLQDHKLSTETAKDLIYGLGKLAELCTSGTSTHSDLVKCGLQPFMGSQILSALLYIRSHGATSPDATFSFMSPTFKDFLKAVTFYLDPNDGGIQDTATGIHSYHYFLAGLSDPMQRKLLETSVGFLFNSGRLSEFHGWLMRTAAEVLPGMDERNHYQVLRLLHHTLSPTLVRESVGSCEWRLIGYDDMRESDCAALAFVVRCLGELQNLNLYRSSLKDEQAEKLMTVFRLAKTINLAHSRVGVGVIECLAWALKEGRSTDVSLSHCKLGDESVKILCSSITHSSCLHTLNLWDCCLTPACSEALAEMLTTSKLCVLNLGANQLNDEGLVRLVAALGTSTCTLQYLGLDLCPLTGSCLTALSSALTSSLSELRNVVLRRTALGDDPLDHLAQALQSGRCKLNTLSLYDCQLTGSCCLALASSLRSEHCSLTELDLSVNELDESSALLICKALKYTNCSLEKLCMSACELTEPVFSALAGVLVCKTCGLKELEVGINKVGDAAAKHILKALKHPHCQLQHLDLEMVELTDACVDELCDAVMASRSLTSLILKNNNLTDVSVPRLVELVQHRPVFQLNVQYNDFSEDVFELMDPYETIRY